MTDHEILEKLRENNPFISSASPMPFQNKNPDLLQLNRDTSEEIERLILYKRRQPSLPLAGLILGEAGTGKTHMLMRILTRLRSNARSTVFVTVKAFWSPESVIQHLLNEICISLKLPHSNGQTQISMIMSKFWDKYQELRRQDGFSNNDIEKLDPRIYISRDIMGLEKIFLKCLLACLSPKYISARSDIVDYLNEGLDDEECLMLGLPPRNLSSMNDEKRENEARKVLIALGLILSYAEVPMIICFDQLDAMKDRQLISAWGNIISLLMNDLSGILPLCFLRSDMWKFFKSILDHAVTQRLQNNTMSMKNCTLNQAKQLIYERIKAEPALKDNADEIFQFLIDRMGKNFSGECSPRTAIEKANQAIISNDDVEIVKTVNVNDDIERQIQNAYEDEYKKIQSAPDTWPPNSDHLTLSLETWLSSLDGFEIQKSDDKYVRLTGNYRDKNLSFIIVTLKNNVSASAGISRGINFLKTNPNELCFYITETKSFKYTWKKTNALREIFEKSGGKFIILYDESRIQWYALTALINRIDSEDVDLYLSSGNRKATRDDIKNFVKSIKLLDFPFDESNESDKPADNTQNKEPISKPDDNKIDKEKLFNALFEFVKGSPVLMLGVEKAIGLLSQREIIITKEKLLAYVNSEDTFMLYKPDDEDPIISLSKK